MYNGTMMITLRADCQECKYDKQMTISVNAPYVSIGKLQQLVKSATKEFKHKHQVKITDKIEVLA